MITPRIRPTAAQMPLLLAGLTGAACLSSTSLHADVIFAADAIQNTIRKFDTATGADLGLFASSGLNTPYALAFDATGNLYVSNAGDATIRKYSPSGTDLGVFASGGLDNAMSLAFDSAGNLYAANYMYGAVCEYDTSGTYLGVFVNTGFNRLKGIAFDSGGNLYAANFDPGGQIKKYSPTGTDLGTFAGSGIGQITGLAFDASGNLLAASYSDIIRKYDPSGIDLGNFASTGLNHPFDIAFDSAGNLYSANYYYANTIAKFDASGSFAGVCGSTPSCLSAIVVQPVPEPDSMMILMGGLVTWLAGRRQRPAATA